MIAMLFMNYERGKGSISSDENESDEVETSDDEAAAGSDCEIEIVDKQWTTSQFTHFMNQLPFSVQNSGVQITCSAISDTASHFLHYFSLQSWCRRL